MSPRNTARDRQAPESPSTLLLLSSGRKPWGQPRPGHHPGEHSSDAVLHPGGRQPGQPTGAGSAVGLTLPAAPSPLPHTAWAVLRKPKGSDTFRMTDVGPWDLSPLGCRGSPGRELRPMLPQSSSSQETFSGRRPARQEAAGPGQSLAFPTDKTQKVRSARGRKRFSSYKTPSHEGLTVQCPAARHAGPRPAPASALPSAFSGPRSLGGGRAARSQALAP